MVTRQELYDRIRTSSKDSVILEEMQRLGFWPSGEQKPTQIERDINRETELRNELTELTTKSNALADPIKARLELRKRRLAESRQKRKETKERRLRERSERTAAWQLRKQKEILYLGPLVSGGLRQSGGDPGRLAGTGLPGFATVAELAEAMGSTVGELRFLAYDRPATTTSHYIRFALPKKTGGQREISAPMPRLKRAQEWILTEILEKVPLHQAANGFRKGRSTITNAQPHVGRAAVINCDVQNFFPTVGYRRIRGVFRGLGYCEELATVLALLCSEPRATPVDLDGAIWQVANGERVLPQGAPTSPALTNIICRKLDARFTGLCANLGFAYSRYADDMTFSCAAEGLPRIGRLLKAVTMIVGEEGFTLHPDKTRVQRRGQHQEVTGLTVNERIGVPRKDLRRFRALLFQIAKDGPAGKSWGNSPHVLSAAAGYANYVAMVDPDKGKALRDEVAALSTRFNNGSRGPSYPQRERWKPRQPEPIPEPSPASAAKRSDQVQSAPRQRPSAQKPQKHWWQFWKWLS